MRPVKGTPYLNPTSTIGNANEHKFRYAESWLLDTCRVVNANKSYPKTNNLQIKKGLPDTKLEPQVLCRESIM